MAEMVWKTQQPRQRPECAKSITRLTAAGQFDGSQSRARDAQAAKETATGAEKETGMVG